MKIAHIHWSLGTGGIETMLPDIANEQAKTNEVALIIINDWVEPSILAKVNQEMVKVVLINRHEGSKNPCGWLGTQIQSGYGVKLWYALKAYCKAFFTIWTYDIVHFHTVPDKICLIIQMPVLLLALLGRKRIVMHIHMGNQLEEHTHNNLYGV